MVKPTKRKRGRPPKRKPATVTEETVHSRLVRGRPQRKRPRPTTPVATPVPPPRPDTILHHAVPISILKPSVPETTTWNSNNNTGASSCIPNSWQYVPNLGLHTLIAGLSLRNDGAYLAVADGVGCITVFSTTPLLRPVGQVSTGLGLKNVKWAIQYMAWNQHCLMVANPQCLQCLDFQQSDPILWTKPILPDTTLQGMEVHNQTVLVWTTDLNLYQTEIRETTEWTSVDSNCCAAKSFQSRLLLVTTDANGLLLHYQDEPQHEARIPMKRIVTQATLQVHNHSTVVLACAKGIRLYNPQLELLQIVGETVSLHGKTVCWQDALIWQAPHDNTVVVGIPSGTKEPKELANVLHLFSKQQLQYWTGPKPANTGIRQVALLQNRQLIVLSQSGHLQFQNLQSPHSNWPGTMYAPGYRVINDNLEYLEQEDELDHPQDEPAGNHIQPENQEDGTNNNNESERLDEAPPEEEEELQGLEQALTACDEDEPVVVVDEDASTQDDNDILPCRPLVHLQQQALMDSSQDAAAQTTTTTTLHLAKVLQEMPNHSLRTQPKKSTVVKSDAPARASGKRSRASNVEALLKASIDPVLQQFMLQRDRTWSNGRRSTHNPNSLPTESSVEKSSNGDDDMQPPSAGNESSSTKAAPEGPTEELILNPATTDDATSTNESATEDSVQKTATNVQISAVHKADALPKDISSPKPSPPPAADEEQAVALQLLNLSPGRPTLELLPDVKPTMALAMPSGLDDGLALKTTEAVPLLSKRTITENANETKQPESAAVLENNCTVESTTETTIPCHACRGRMVIHSCGKRAIPIDHEAVARAERERLQKEEDEKRRIRTEKRRLADAKRREARKRKQKEAEERLRKAEQERLRKERAQLEEARRLAAARSRDWPEVESWRRVIFPGETSGRLEEKHEHSEAGTDRSQGVNWPPQDSAPESDPWRRKDLLPESNPPLKTPPTQAIWPARDEPSQSDDKPWGNGKQTSKMNEAQQRQGDSLRQPSYSYDQAVAQSRSPQAQTLSSEQSQSTNWQAQEPSFSSPGPDMQQQQVSLKSQPFLANGQWTSKPKTVNHLSRKDPPAAAEVPANRAPKDWSSSSQGAEAAFGHFQSRFRQNEERSCWLVASPIATKSTGTLRPASPTWPKESAPVPHTTAHKPTDEFGQSKRDETASGSRAELDSSATLDHATALAALAGLADMPVLQPKAQSEGNPVYASQWSASSNDATEGPPWTYGASESGAVWLGSNAATESEPAGATRHDWRVEPREAQVREAAHQTFITGYSEAASFVVTSPETWRNGNHHPGDGTFVAQGTSSLNDTTFPPQEKS